MVYELRRYVAAPGKTDALLERFSNGTTAILERCGARIEGFWREREDRSALVYLCAFPDETSRVAAGERFAQDEGWKRLKAESEREQGGPLTVTIETTILEPVPGLMP